MLSMAITIVTITVLYCYHYFQEYYQRYYYFYSITIRTTVITTIKSCPFWSSGLFRFFIPLDTPLDNHTHLLVRLSCSRLCVQMACVPCLVVWRLWRDLSQGLCVYVWTCNCSRRVVLAKKQYQQFIDIPGGVFGDMAICAYCAANSRMSVTQLLINPFLPPLPENA